MKRLVRPPDPPSSHSLFLSPPDFSNSWGMGKKGERERERDKKVIVK